MINKLVKLFTDPFYFAQKGLSENISGFSKYIKGKVLDVGCGNKPYQKLFSCTEYIGLEIDTPRNRKNKNVDFFYKGGRFPFKNGEFGSVVSTQVLEHVSNPDAFLKEINRVLKKNGYLLLTVPFIWDEHEQPHDFRHYSSFGIRHLLESHKFKIIACRKSINDIRVIFQLLNNYIYKKIASKNYKIRTIFYLLLISPSNLLGSFLSRILPENDDLYLDNIILAKKINA